MHSSKRLDLCSAERVGRHLWEVLVLVGKVDLDHQVKMTQVIVRGGWCVGSHDQLTLFLCARNSKNFQSNLVDVEVPVGHHAWAERAAMQILVVSEVGLFGTLYYEKICC